MSDYGPVEGGPSKDSEHKKKDGPKLEIGMVLPPETPGIAYRCTEMSDMSIKPAPTNGTYVPEALSQGHTTLPLEKIELIDSIGGPAGELEQTVAESEPDQLPPDPDYLDESSYGMSGKSPTTHVQQPANRERDVRRRITEGLYRENKKLRHPRADAIGRVIEEFLERI